MLSFRQRCVPFWTNSSYVWYDKGTIFTIKYEYFYNEMNKTVINSLSLSWLFMNIYYQIYYL